MPIKVKLENGTEIETVTPEEIKQQSELISGLTQQIKTLQEKPDASAEIKTQVETLKTQLESVSGNLTKNVEEAKTTTILGLAGGDKDLAAKIEQECKNFKSYESATSPADILDIAKKAYNIVAPVDAPNAIDAFLVATGGRGAIVKPSASAQETPAQAAFRRNMGISDEDYQKYGNKNK